MSQSQRSLHYVAPVLRVADLTRSLAYYRARLGFEVEFNYEGFYASVLREGYRVHLKCSGVENVESLASDFASAGASFSVALRQMPYGREFYVRDPDGYILGFVQPNDA
jgi:uncharacterized glyoxalase superfamily protein PhnB